MAPYPPQWADCRRRRLSWRGRASSGQIRFAAADAQCGTAKSPGTLCLTSPTRLRALLAFLAHGPFGGGEADLGVRAVAERFGGRPPAAAQGDRGPLSSIFDAVSVTHNDRALDEVRPVLEGCDGDCFVAHANGLHPARRRRTRTRWASHPGNRRELSRREWCTSGG